MEYGWRSGVRSDGGVAGGRFSRSTAFDFPLHVEGLQEDLREVRLDLLIIQLDASEQS